MTLDKTVVVCNYPVSTLSSNEILEKIENWSVNKFSVWIVTLNLEMIALGDRESEYSALIRKCDFFIADGMPIVWLSRIVKDKKANAIACRTGGADLVERVILNHYDKGIAIIGGVNPVSALDKLIPEKKYNRVVIDTIIDPSDSELLDEICEKILKENIYFVFVALGVPKQDKVAIYLRKKLTSHLIIGVGGSFELLSGMKKRSPKLLQEFGLEWFWRLLVEPKRLWKRYLLNYPRGVKTMLFFTMDVWMKRLKI